MATQSLATRVDSLEQRVTRLEELPTRIDALTLQVSQLRDEMHGEFSAIREEIRAGDENTCRTLRDEIHAGDENTVRILRDEIRSGLAEAMAQARMLHEEQKAAIALIGEGSSRGRQPRFTRKT